MWERPGRHRKRKEGYFETRWVEGDFVPDVRDMWGRSVVHVFFFFFLNSIYIPADRPLECGACRGSSHGRDGRFCATVAREKAATGVCFGVASGKDRRESVK